ncbi:hypothetical protein ACWDTI_22050 [Gordonia sp. NPDC003424]
MVHKPKWFTDGQVYVSYAPTVGINKDGEELYVVDRDSGLRTTAIDDQLAVDVASLRTGKATTTARWVEVGDLTPRLMAVPAYFDARPLSDFSALMQSSEMGGYGSTSLGALIDDGRIEALAGHGSPSADLRLGDVPYIKVSDIRAGQININPTNRVSRVVAERFWKGKESGIRAWDLVTPIRTSKNIGDFAVIMPGQEQMVLTKEVLILRASELASFDNFYLLWAMTLKAVRRQWDRVVFMQTNREDVGKRYREIMIPIPPNRRIANKAAEPFRSYYEGMDRLRTNLVTYLESDEKHHIFISTVEAAEEDQELTGE